MTICVVAFSSTSKLCTTFAVVFAVVMFTRDPFCMPHASLTWMRICV